MNAMITISASALLLVAAACDGGGEPVADHTLAALHSKIFVPRCSATVCHGGAGAVDGLDLDGDPFGTLVNVDSVEVAGGVRVKPGDPENSVLFQCLQGSVGALGRMPVGVPDGLDPADIELVRLWIEDGAEDN